jgi:hypothetical protein
MITADLYDQETYNNIVLLIDAFETAALESETREGIIMSMQGPIEGFKTILQGADESLNRMKKIGTPPGYSSKSSVPSPTGSQDDTADSTLTASYVPGENDGFTLNQDNAIPTASFEIGGGSLNLGADYGSLLGMSPADAAKFEAYMAECWNCNTRINFNWQIPLVDLLGPIFSLLNDINQILDELEELTNPVNFLRNFCRWMNWFTLVCPADWIALLMALKMLFTKYLTFALSAKLDWTVLLGPIINFIVDALSSLIQQIAGVVLNPLDCLEGIFMTLSTVEYQAKDTYATMKAAKEEFLQRLKEIKGGEILPNAEAKLVFTGLYWDGAKKKFVRTDQLIDGKNMTGIPDGTKTLNPWKEFISGAEFTSARTMKEAIQKPATDDLFFNKFVSAIAEAKDNVSDFFNEILASLRSIKGLVAGGLSVQLEAYGFMLLILSIIRFVVMIINLIKENKDVTDWCQFVEEHPDKLEDALKRFVDPTSSAKEGTVTVSGHTLPLSACISSRDPQESVMLSKWISELTENRT